MGSRLRRLWRSFGGAETWILRTYVGARLGLITTSQFLVRRRRSGSRKNFHPFRVRSRARSRLACFVRSKAKTSQRAPGGTHAMAAADKWWANTGGDMIPTGDTGWLLGSRRSGASSPMCPDRFDRPAPPQSLSFHIVYRSGGLGGGEPRRRVARAHSRSDALGALRLGFCRAFLSRTGVMICRTTL